MTDPLIIAAVAGDRDALGALYEQHSQALRSYLMKRGHDAATAEDLVADVWVRVIRDISRYEDRGWSFRAWLYRIAHDRSVDLQRHQRHEVRALRQMIHLAPVAAHELPEPEVLTQLRAARDTLPVTQRLVLELRFEQEVPCTVVAVQLGTTEGAVKALRYRALVTLRRRLERVGVR